MKRKGSFSNPTYPLPLLRASPRCPFLAVRGSEFQLPCSTPRGNNDSSRRKRVKIKDLDRDRILTCRTDASLIPLKQRQVSQSKNAKTSEFAFFKKFKEDASLRFNFSPLHQKELQSKKFKSSDRFRERTSPVKNSCKNFTSHFLVEDVTPVNFYPPHSPLGNSSKISEVDVKQALTTLKEIQSKQRNVENNGTLHSHSDIFNRKWQKLRQFIGNLSPCGTGDSYENGYGLVSMLLSRLIPESNENKSDNNFERLRQLPARCFSRLEHGRSLDNNSSPCQFTKSRGRVLSHSDSPTNSDDYNFHLKYSTKESDCELEEKVTLLDVNDSSFTAAVEKYRSRMSSRFRPLDSSYDLNEPLQLRKQMPKAFLLGWDNDNMKDSSPSQLTELNTFSTPPTSFADDHRPNLQESFGAVGLCSSPFPSGNSINFYSLPYSSLAGYQIHGWSRHNIEKKEDIAAYFNNMHLKFSYVPECPSQCDNYIDHIDSSNFVRPQSGHWCMNNVFDDGRQHRYIQSLYASSFVFDLGWEYLSSSRERCEAAYHILEFPLDEVRPEVPVDEECSFGSSDNVFLKDWSFLRKELCHIPPDELSWDADESEISHDKTDMNYV